MLRTKNDINRRSRRDGGGGWLNAIKGSLFDQQKGGKHQQVRVSLPFM